MSFSAFLVLSCDFPWSRFSRKSWETKGFKAASYDIKLDQGHDLTTFAGCVLLMNMLLSCLSKHYFQVISGDMVAGCAALLHYLKRYCFKKILFDVRRHQMDSCIPGSIQPGWWSVGHLAHYMWARVNRSTCARGRSFGATLRTWEFDAPIESG